MFFRAGRRKAGSQRCAELRGFAGKNLSDHKQTVKKKFTRARVRGVVPAAYSLVLATLRTSTAEHG